MNNNLTRINMPAPIQVAHDLTCALVAGGKFSFTGQTNEERMDELLKFVMAQSQKAGKLSVRTTPQ